MSFQHLPPELFIEIVDYLHKNDRDCLRITCRKFQAYLPCPIIRKKRPGFSTASFQRLRDRGDITLRLDFLSRLFLPGNLFHGQQGNVVVCGRCCVIRPLAKFPLEMTRDGYRTCEDCTVTIMGEDMERGCWMVYKGKKYGSCDHCGNFLSEDELHSHDIASSTPSTYESICIDCHYDYCDDLQCGGWTTECILSCPGHFCTGDVSDGSACGQCASCFTIAMMMMRSQGRREQE